MEEAVLVPGAGKNIGGQGRRQRAARDKAEIARPGACHGGGRAEFIEFRQHLHPRTIGSACSGHVEAAEALEGLGRRDTLRSFNPSKRRADRRAASVISVSSMPPAPTTPTTDCGAR